jgi:uncharacterized protein (DUF2141 family)
MLHFLFLLIGTLPNTPGPRLGPSIEAASGFDLTISIMDLRAEEGGALRVALYNEHGQVIRTAQVAVTGTKATVTFLSVAGGTYAVRYFQDSNANGRLDVGWFKIPDEGVGCSNDAKGFMSAPGFKDLLFKVDRETSIVSHITYY